MPDNDFTFKAALAALVVIGGLFAYRMVHPSTTFAADGTDPTWDAAVERSHSAAQPTVVLFTAGWCPACRALHANVLAQGDVRQELYAHYSFHTVDLTRPTREDQLHAQKYGITSIPTMIRFDPSGKETDRTHYLPPAQMIDWLKSGE